MKGDVGIEVAELVVPGSDAADGTRVARAMHRELGRLWQEDQRIGLQWEREIGALTLELDASLDGESLGEAIARKIRERALTRGERS